MIGWEDHLLYDLWTWETLFQAMQCTTPKSIMEARGDVTWRRCILGVESNVKTLEMLWKEERWKNGSRM